MLRSYEENGLTSRMARFVCETQYRDIPADIREYAKVMTADSLACGFGASALSSAQNFVKVAEQIGGGGQAVVLTTGQKVSSGAAAFVNAYLINALDADDTFYTTCHPMAPILATALAVAEETGASGQDLITALVVGYDVAIRCKRSILKRQQGFMGWFVMGCVAAAAKLYGLDELQTAMAFGTAAFTAPHTNGRWNLMASGRRHDMKYWATHATAFSAVTAAQLVRAGVTSDRTIFDGEWNYSHFIGFDGIDAQLMVEDLGTRWWIGETSIKPWAVCRYSQIAITLIRQIIAEFDLKPGDIESVKIQTWDFIASPWFCQPGEITSEYDAQFSFPHAVAATILGWDMGPEWQSRAIHNPELDAAAAKVSVSPNPRFDADSVITDEGNKYMATIVRLTAKGREYCKEGGTALGDPFEPQFKMTIDTIREKYFSFSRYSLDSEQIKRTFENVRRLEAIDNVRFQLTC